MAQLAANRPVGRGSTFEPDAGDKARRRARWSINPKQLRMGRFQELERQLVQSAVLEDAEDEEDGAEDSPGGGRQRQVTIEEVAAQPMELSGFLLKKSGALSGQKRRFFVLKQGTLIWYKHEKDASPTGYCHLEDVSALLEYESYRRPAAGGSASGGGGGGSGGSSRLGGLFGSGKLRSGKESPELDDPSALTKSADGGSGGGTALVVKAMKDYVLWADDTYDRDRWLRALRHNHGFEPLPGLDAAGSLPQAAEPTDKKSAKKSMLSNLALRAEKKLVGRAVTSDLGKKLLREYCLPETFSLLQAMRDMASLDPLMPPKHGAKIESTILRMAVKVALLHQHGRLVPRDFDPVVHIVDVLCVDFVRKYDAVSTPPHTDEEDPEHERLSTRMRALNAALRLLLKEHMSPKNVDAVSEVLAYLGLPLNMSRFTSEPKCFAELGKMAESLRRMYGLDDAPAE